MVIGTARLHIRSYRDADLADLVALAGNWEIARWVGTIPHPYSEADGRDWIARVQENHATGRLNRPFVPRHSGSAAIEHFRGFAGARSHHVYSSGLVAGGEDALGFKHPDELCRPCRCLLRLAAVPVGDCLGECLADLRSRRRAGHVASIVQPRCLGRR